MKTLWTLFSMCRWAWKDWYLTTSSFCMYVIICTLIHSYTTYLKNLLLFAASFFFSSVSQEPLMIPELCFSSTLTVIAIWKLAQQNWISNSVASLLVDLEYFRLYISSPRSCLFLSIQELTLECIEPSETSVLGADFIKIWVRT